MLTPKPIWRFIFLTLFLGVAGNNVAGFAADANINLQAIEIKTPVYPKSLLASGQSCEVTVGFVVNTQGVVQNPEILKATHATCEGAALEAILRSSFRPAQHQGHPIAVKAEQTFRFAPFWEQVGKEAYKITNDHNQFDQPPKVKLAVAPVYPTELLKSETTGAVTLRFMVGIDGHVYDAVIERATHPDFGSAAKAMINAWVFEPAAKGGQPVAALIRKELVFDLKATAENSVSKETRQVLAHVKANAPVYGLSELDNIPKPLVQIEPIYPSNLSGERISGKVVVKFLIDQYGLVQLPEILSATHDDFAWAALTAVSRWRFEPPKSSAQTVVAETQIPINFKTE